MAEHKDLTGADLHEAKGAATAAANTVLQADGAGSAQWNDIISPLKAANRIAVSIRITDISAPDTDWIPAPMAGTIVGIAVTLHNAITAADTTLTFRINGVAITGSTIVCAFTGSAPGSTFTSTPSANNTVAQWQPIEIITDGASGTTSTADVVFLINTA